ncbi:MAG: hypothetical protein ABSD58_09225 [Verrucomicrobiia bacterium]|jgi:hypothetical protein
MKIHAIKTKLSPPALDLDQFSKELRELSERFSVRLVSLGSIATVDEGKLGSMYLAVWEVEAKED